MIKGALEELSMLTYVFLGGVVHTVSCPEEINFVCHTVEPVVTEVYTKESDKAKQ
jgi:hypothetical protein